MYLRTGAIRISRAKWLISLMEIEKLHQMMILFFHTNMAINSAINYRFARTDCGLLFLAGDEVRE